MQSRQIDTKLPLTTLKQKQKFRSYLVENSSMVNNNVIVKYDILTLLNLFVKKSQI